MNPQQMTMLMQLMGRQGGMPGAVPGGRQESISTAAGMPQALQPGPGPGIDPRLLMAMLMQRGGMPGPGMPGGGQPAQGIGTGGQPSPQQALMQQLLNPPPSPMQQVLQSIQQLQQSKGGTGDGGGAPVGGNPLMGGGAGNQLMQILQAMRSRGGPSAPGPGGV